MFKQLQLHFTQDNCILSNFILSYNNDKEISLFLFTDTVCPLV